jgi:hypothetical protein
VIEARVYMANFTPTSANNWISFGGYFLSQCDTQPHFFHLHSPQQTTPHLHLLGNRLLRPAEGMGEIISPPVDAAFRQNFPLTCPWVYTINGDLNFLQEFQLWTILPTDLS